MSVIDVKTADFETEVLPLSVLPAAGCGFQRSVSRKPAVLFLPCPALQNSRLLYFSWQSKEKSRKSRAERLPQLQFLW